MIDIIILICCTLCGFFLGKFFEKQISTKGVFYQDLRKYISLLKENVVGRQLELDSFNNTFASKCSHVFAEYLLNDKIKCRFSALQKNNITEFFSNLDCVSSEQLSNHIDYYEKLLSEDMSYVQENEVKKASVYSKVGALIGAIIGILFM